MTSGDEVAGQPPGDEESPPQPRGPMFSARMSYLLIGGAALGGIVLMCLVVLLLALARQN